MLNRLLYKRIMIIGMKYYDDILCEIFRIKSFNIICAFRLMGGSRHRWSQRLTVHGFRPILDARDRY